MIYFNVLQIYIIMPKKTRKNKKNKKKENKKKYSGRRKTQTKSKLDTDTRTQDPNEFRLLRCAPNVEGNNAFSTTCYTKDAFDKLKDAWNLRNKNEHISSNNPKQIWEFLRRKFNNVCEHERCWLEQEFMKNSVTKDMKLYTHAPTHPNEWKKNIDEWLDSYDIKRVMRQYEHKYPSFSFIGPSPVNYYTIFNDGHCVWDDLCKFKLEKMIKRKTDIGVIFNLDPHYMDGSHWVALYLDLKRGKIYYFDSVGKEPHPDIMQFIQMVQLQSIQLDNRYDYIQNTLQHQQRDGQCGMYCIYFILSMLERKMEDKDKIADELMNNRIEDDKMAKLRSILYNDK
jgi:hypothetical protein